MTFTHEQPWPLPIPPWHLGLWAISTIVKTSPRAFSRMSPLRGRKKKRLGATLNSWVPSFFWTLARAHWSSSNPSLEHPKKKSKHEIVGRERSLLLGLLLFVLEKLRHENEEESHVIHFETLRITFCKKQNLNIWNVNIFLTSSSITSWCYNMRFLFLACAIFFPLLCWFEFVHKKDCQHLFAMGFNVASLYSCICGMISCVRY